MALHPIGIFHISDIHMRANDSGAQGWRRRQVLGDAWDENLREVLGHGKIDLVCITGDLAHSGVRAEYDLLTPFISELMKSLQVRSDRLFIVPGNHDVDRTKAAAAWAGLRDINGDDGEKLARWMADTGPALRGIDPAFRDQVLERQDEYRRWLRDTLHRQDLLPDVAAGHPRLGFRSEVKDPAWPFTVTVVGLDSAWLAGNENDKGKLWLTDEQVGQLTSGSTGLRLALVHHPLSDLADGSTSTRLLAKEVDLLLRGHLHEADLTGWCDPDHYLTELAAGCLYSSNTYPNSCQRIDLAVNDSGQIEQLTVRFFTWSSRGHWYRDSGIYKAAKDGVYSLTRQNGVLRPR